MKDIFSIKDKVVCVTGGNGFLGSEVINHLKEQGCQAISLDMRGVMSVDITSKESVKNAIDLVIAKHKKIDGLVHLAALDAIPQVGGSLQFSPYEEYPIDLWEQAFKVNVAGAQIVTQCVAPLLMQQQTGTVIFVASDLGLIAPNNSIYEEGQFKDIAYATSKAAIIGLSRNWASYLGSYNVRVNTLCPGGVFNGQNIEFVKKNQKLNMFGRMAQRSEYNGALQFLLSDASSYMTGANLVIDGGRTAW